METRKRHKFLQYDSSEVQLVRKACGIESLEHLTEGIVSIQEWFQKQPHLVRAGIDPEVIEMMIILCKGSAERAKQRIERLYTLKTLTQEISQNRDIKSDPFVNMWKYFRYITMPKLFDGARITHVQFIDSDSELYDFQTTLKIGFMIADIRLKYDYCSGDIFVFDFANTTFGHLAKVNLYLMKKCEALYQQGYGSRIVAVHVLNAPSFIDKLLFLVKQVLKPKIVARIMLHSSLDDLHEHLPKEYLPQNYGGSQPSMKELADLWRAELESNETRNFLLKSEKIRSEESLRVGGGDEGDGEMAGTFRKLELD